jgi:hypothetical protein
MDLWHVVLQAPFRSNSGTETYMSDTYHKLYYDVHFIALLLSSSVGQYIEFKNWICLMNPASRTDLMYIGPCIVVVVNEMKNQLDAT